MGVRISKYRINLVRESASVYQVDKRIRNPEQAASVIRELINVETLHVEHMGLLALNTKNDVIGFHVLYTGTLDSAAVHPRNIFQAALLNNAATVILFHNHPSGDPTPSSEDVCFTKRVMEAGEILGIGVLDHIVLGDLKHVSIKESGLLMKGGE